MTILKNIDYYRIKFLRKYLDNNFFYIPKRREQMDYLFSGIEDLCNPEKTIRHCFNTFYNDGFFLKALHYFLVKKESFYVDGCYWLYPDDDNQNVIFEIGFNDPEWIVEVSKLECFEYTKIACKRFLELHPEIKYKQLLGGVLVYGEP